MILSSLAILAQLACGPIGDVHQLLTKDMGESVLVTLPAANADTIRIYVGPKSWTVILVKGDKGCLLAEGQGASKFGAPGKDS